MASPAQILANQQNAQRSTGPKTEDGKRRSSLNAIRNGNTSQMVVLPSEDVTVYNSFCENWFEQFEPKNGLEAQLVQTLADTQWRINRIRAQETYILAGAHDNENEQSPLDRALAEADIVRRDGAALNTLSMREQRLHKLFQSTLKQLTEVQKERRAREQQELAAAHALSLHYKKLDAPFNPKDFGFVLTKEDLELFIWRLRMRHDADLAYRTPRPEPISAPAEEAEDTAA